MGNDDRQIIVVCYRSDGMIEPAPYAELSLRSSDIAVMNANLRSNALETNIAPYELAHLGIAGDKRLTARQTFLNHISMVSFEIYAPKRAKIGADIEKGIQPGVIDKGHIIIRWLSKKNLRSKAHRPPQSQASDRFHLLTKLPSLPAQALKAHRSAC